LEIRIPLKYAKWTSESFYALPVDAKLTIHLCSPTLQIGRLVFKTILTPCHTQGSVMYFMDIHESLAACSKTAGAGPSGLKPAKDALKVSCLFTGDTIFVGGVGQ
jgi:glyoxylase-like metal-dependent hydrolase (beta-lactamase superfamily II)